LIHAAPRALWPARVEVPALPAALIRDTVSRIGDLTHY
jgi:hypothetical protein